MSSDAIVTALLQCRDCEEELHHHETRCPHCRGYPKTSVRALELQHVPEEVLRDCRSLEDMAAAYRAYAEVMERLTQQGWRLLEADGYDGAWRLVKTVSEEEDALISLYGSRERPETDDEPPA